MAACFVRITASNRDRLLALQDVPELDIFRHTARELADEVCTVEGLLLREQIDLLKAEGYVVVVIADADELTVERRRELGTRKNQHQGNAFEV